MKDRPSDEVFICGPVEQVHIDRAVEPFCVTFGP